MSSDCFLMAGVMGWPVMHSRSPKIHNYWFAKYGLGGTYVPLAIRPHGLGAALRALAPLGFAGCNLTIPHKETAVEIVDRIDSPARRIGAINCVVVAPDGTLDGSNNDGLGYIESILEYEPGWRADLGPIVVIGAGGAARASALAREFGAPIAALPWEDRHAALDGAAMLINTTSQGMAGEAALDLVLDRLPTAALVSDIVYVPRDTPLLTAARRCGNRTAGGLGMLLHQARAAFHAWFGVKPEITAQLRAMIEATI